MFLDVFNKELTRIDIISQYSYCKCKKQLNAAGSFEIHIPLSSTARNIRQSGKFILFTRDTCGMITYVSKSEDEETNNNEVIIKGYLTNHLLSMRCLPSVLNFSDTKTNICRSIVNSNFVSPVDSKRAMPIQLSTTQKYIPSSPSVVTQITGGAAETRIEEILDSEEMGYDVAPVLGQTSISHFEFRVIKGEDRTVGNSSGNAPVVFSKDLKNLLNSTYTYNANDSKNMAYVAGEGEGTDRTVVESGNTSATGLDRLELYVDARDLQSTDEKGNKLTPSQYADALIQRGAEKLEECKEEEVYEVSVNTLNPQFIFGKDYFLGDLVTIQDVDLGLVSSARVTEVEITATNGRELVDVTFGYYKLTTNQKLKRNEVL